MQHSYDLLLQGTNPGDPVPLDQLVAGLKDRGAQLSADGRGLWKLSGGEVTISPLQEDGGLKGLDVRVPYLGSSDLLETVLRELVDVAEAAQARVLDPQRGEAATLTTLSSVANEYLRLGRYAGEYGGVSEALGLSTWAATPDEESSSSFRWLMILAVFSVALYVGWRTISSIRANRDPAAQEAPGPVDVTPKVPGK